MKGEEVVAAHAHGELMERIVGGEVAGFQVGVEVLEVMEFFLDLGFVVGVGGHAHEAGYFYVGGGGLLLPLLDEGFELGGVEAEFGFFFGDVDLEEAVDDAVVFGGLFVDLLEQAEAVNCVDHGDEGGDVFYFVGLEVANEMPFDVGREEGLFFDEFLNVVFAEEAMAGVV